MKINGHHFPGYYNSLSIKLILVSILFTLSVSNFAYAQSADNKALPTVGAEAVLGKIDGIDLAVKVQSPSNQSTPLQIVCVFEYTEGDITSPQALPATANGLLHVDNALNGLITDLRKSGKFTGYALETLLIVPPKGLISAEKLLLIGLGNRNNFDPAFMVNVGIVGMREALRLGVRSYSHASDLKDQGIDSPTKIVATNVIKGAIEAYETETYLQTKRFTSFKPVTKITLLSGPPFFEPTKEAVTSVTAARAK